MPDRPTVNSICRLLDEVKRQTDFARACMFGAEQGTAPANRWDRAEADLETAAARLGEAREALALMDKQEPYCIRCGQPLLRGDRMAWSHFTASVQPRREVAMVPAADAGHEPELDWRTVGEVYPPPRFSHRAYGVDLEWFGEDGGMVARGHVPDLRFIAACNHMARKVAGLRNIWDDPAPDLEETLAAVSRIWAVRADPAAFAVDPDGWAVSWGGVTEDTPGAFPLTVLEP